MKIAVIIDTWFPQVGGGQINAWEIAKRTAKEGYKVDIITRNNGVYHEEKVRNLSVYKLGQKSEAVDNISRVFFLFKTLFLIKKNNYDVVHLQAFLPGLLSPLLRSLLRKPTVLTVHGTRMFEQHPRSSFGFLLEKIILTKIKYDVQISVTKAFLKFKNVNRNIKVTGNGIDFKKFENIKAKKAGYPKILWVGRFDKVKRVENLIMAMRDIVKKIPDVKLTLVGYGYEENHLKKLARKLNLNKHVEFVGKKSGDDLIREYKSSHLFVLPSSSEGQPITILEAMACGLPIIATKTGGIPEILKDGVNGLLVPPNDYIALTDAIIWCLKSKNNFGKIGHTMVSKMNSWDHIASQTLSVYKRISK